MKRKLKGNKTCSIQDLLPAQEVLVVSNLRLVVYLARRVSGRGVSLPDLIQEGNLGLMTAIDKFEWQRGYKLSTSAVWWIRSGLSKAFIDRYSTVRLPGYCRQKIADLKRHMADVQTSTGCTPDTHELAEQMDMSEKEVHELLTLAREPVPLENREHDDRPSLIDVLVNEHSSNPHAVLEREQAGKQISILLEKALNPMERRLVALRFGLNTDTPHTLRELAGMFSLSREGVRQVEMRALAKMRNQSGAK